MSYEKLKKRFLLSIRKRNLLRSREEYNHMMEEFQAYEYKLYKFQDKILEERGGKLLEKIENISLEEVKETLQHEKDTQTLLTLFKDDIVFK